jgi:hypothetical protein
MNRRRTEKLRWAGLICLFAAILLTGVTINVAGLNSAQFIALMVVTIVLTGSAILLCTEH